jgi:signal transduction histidine kinase
MTMRELFGQIDDRYRTYVEDIHASGMLLLDMINDLLDIARLETGEMELDEGSVDIEKAVQEGSPGSGAACHAASGDLTWVPSAAELPDICCDRRTLRQMLLNMLSSAAKFDKPGRMVEVGTDLWDGLAIVINDTGWGVVTDALRLILTKSLIERHGGNLSIVSTPNDGIHRAPLISA